MDADGQMAPSDLPRLVRPLVNGVAEYTKGNRFYVINANRSMPKARKFGSVVLTFMTKMSSGYWHIFDSQCGFTAMRAHLLKMIDLDAIAQDYFFENDMLIWLNTVRRARRGRADQDALRRRGLRRPHQQGDVVVPAAAHSWLVLPRRPASTCSWTSARSVRSGCSVRR